MFFFSSGKPCKDRIHTSQQEIWNLELAEKNLELALLTVDSRRKFSCFKSSHLFCWSSKTHRFLIRFLEEFDDVFCTEEASWKARCPMYRPLLQWVSLALRLTKKAERCWNWGCETCVGIEWFLLWMFFCVSCG